MDAKERRRIQKMSESISLPEEEMRKLQVSLEIDLGGGAENSPEELKRMAEEEERRQQEELQQLLEKTKQSNPDFNEEILGPGKRGEPDTPFAMEQKPEVIELPEEAEQEDAPRQWSGLIPKWRSGSPRIGCTLLFH